MDEGWEEEKKCCEAQVQPTRDKTPDSYITEKMSVASKRIQCDMK